MIVLKSDLAILDVKAGRATLRKHIKKIQRGKIGPLVVTIRGTISDSWGPDDGISQEFQVDVESVEVEA